MVIGSCLVTYLTSVGGFRHLASLTPQQQVDSVKWNWITQPFFVANFGVSKLATSLLILRLLGPNSKARKWFLYIIMSFTSVLTICFCIFIYAQCNPPRALWTPGLPARCWSANAYQGVVLAQAGKLRCYQIEAGALMSNSLVHSRGLHAGRISGHDDLEAENARSKARRHKFFVESRCLVSIRINTDFPHKTDLNSAGILGCVKIPYLSELNAKSDLTWDMFPLFGLTISEIALIIYAGCVPTLKPLYDRLFRQKHYQETYGSKQSWKTSSPGRAGIRSGIYTQKSYDILLEPVTAEIPARVLSREPSTRTMVYGRDLQANDLARSC